MTETFRPGPRHRLPSASTVLLASVFAGMAAGLFWREKILWVKPAGDLFLAVLFAVLAPLVFFSLASAMLAPEGAGAARSPGKIFLAMLAVFVLTGVASSVLMIAILHLMPGVVSLPQAALAAPAAEASSPGRGFAHLAAVLGFFQGVTRRHMLALILIGILTGIGVQASGARGTALARSLRSGNKFMMRLVALIMRFAPVGLGAYFACLAARLGGALAGTYWNILCLYYPVALGYFFLASSAYAFWGGGGAGVRRFWKHIGPPALTAFASSSSLAAVPASLEACERIGVRSEVSRVVIPIGATLHMDGSCLAAVLKIAVLFGFYGMPFEGAAVFAGAIGASILAAMVMSGIPGGGFLGEMMILHLYGFPAEALPLASLVGILVDPPATMVNAAGDTSAAMMVERMVVRGKG
ncbi:MAG: dicarboxylate/amino acid:cation symporter [Candidatus Omnitrophota bacterium]